MCADERISARSPHCFRNSSAPGLDDEISSTSVDGRSGDGDARFDSRDLRTTRSDDHERACREGSCASVRVDTTTGDDQPDDPVVEGKDGVQVAGGFSAFAEAVLGAPYVGEGIFLL